MKNNSKVVIIISSFKNHLQSKTELFRCSLKNLVGKTRYSNFEIYISDYGTTDMSSNLNELLLSCKADVFVNKHENDFGLAARKNLALKAALDRKPEYIVMMDDDMIVTDPDWLEKLVQIMKSVPKQIVALQPTLFESNGKTIAGGFLYKNATTYVLQLDENLNKKRVWQTFITAGSCFIVRKSYIAELFTCGIEPFCQLFEMQSEDTDFQLKIYLRKYLSAGTSAVNILHARPESRILTPKRQYLAYRNRVLLLLLHFSLGHTVKNIMLRLMTDIYHSFFVYGRNKKKTSPIALILMIRAYFEVFRRFGFIWKTRLCIQKFWRNADESHLEKILLSSSLLFKKSTKLNFS